MYKKVVHIITFKDDTDICIHRDPGKVQAKRAKKNKIGAKLVWNKNIQNKATKSVFIIITWHYPELGPSSQKELQNHNT
jgi:hypothetical protein